MMLGLDEGCVVVASGIIDGMNGPGWMIRRGTLEGKRSLWLGAWSAI
jgi:hypothetical protein